MQVNKIAFHQQPDFGQEKSNNVATGDGFNELLQLLMNMNLTGMVQQNMPELGSNLNQTELLEEGQQLLLNNPLNAELLMDAKAAQNGELAFTQDGLTEKESLNNDPLDSKVLEMANQVVSQEMPEDTMQPVSNIIQDTQSQQMPQNLQQVAAATNQVVQTTPLAADIKQAPRQTEPVKASSQAQQEVPEGLTGNVAKEDDSFTKISLTDQQPKDTDQQTAKSNTDSLGTSKMVQKANLPEGEGLQQRLETEQSVKVSNQHAQRPQLTVEVPLNQLPDRVAEMVKAMMLQRSPGATSLKMKLQPEHLGEVTVKLTWSKGELSAQFVAATNMAKEALETSFPQLKQLLAQQNIQLSEAAVFMEQDTDKWQQQGSQDSHSRWEHQSRFKVQAGYPLPELIGGLEQETQQASVKAGVNIVV